MFTLIEPVELQGWREQVSDFFGLTRPTAEWHECGRHPRAAFQRLNCPVGRRGIDWQFVADTAGSNLRRLLLPPEIEIPPELPAHRYESGAFRGQLLLDTALRILKECRVPLQRRSVALVDPEGKLQNWVLPLIGHAAQVCIVTDQPERYEGTARELLDEYGIPLPMTASRELAGRQTLVIAPALERVDGFSRRGAPTLTCGSAGQTVGAPFLSLEDLRLPEFLEGIKPRTVSRIDFAGAVFEFCDEPAAMRESEPILRCGKRQLSGGEIAGYLESGR